jgi:hypothetical protein
MPLVSPILTQSQLDFYKILTGFYKILTDFYKSLTDFHKSQPDSYPTSD